MKAKTLRPVIFREDTRFSLEDKSLREIIDRPKIAEVLDILGTKDDFVCHSDVYQSACMAGRKFWKRTASASITFKNGRIYGALTPEITRVLKQGFHLDWMNFNYVTRVIRNDKYLWQQVLSGKITNPEMLLKRFSHRYFKGVYSYGTLKKWFSGYINGISLWKAYYYTTNPNLFLEKYMDNESAWNLYQDVLRYCEYDNSTINPLWSLKRLQEEHQKQIEKSILEEAESLSDRNIAEPFTKDGLSLVLNERECYREGSIMHNCVHTCYWKAIEGGNYLLAKGTIGDTKIDLGIRISRGLLFFDQAHSIYNGTVSNEIVNLCNHWITSNKEELLNIVKQIKDVELQPVEEKEEELLF